MIYLLLLQHLYLKTQMKKLYCEMIYIIYISEIKRSGWNNKVDWVDTSIQNSSYSTQKWRCVICYELLIWRCAQSDMSVLFICLSCACVIEGQCCIRELRLIWQCSPQTRNKTSAFMRGSLIFIIVALTFAAFFIRGNRKSWNFSSRRQTERETCFVKYRGL